MIAGKKKSAGDTSKAVSTVIAFVLIIWSAGASADTVEIRGSKSDLVDAIFSEYGSNTPGCAVAVDHQGEIVHMDGYGMADLEQSITIKPNSVFYAGSVSKQVVAMAVLMLDRDERIDIDTAVRNYLPSLPEYADQVTARQLLHHTSGIWDYSNLFDLAGVSQNAVIDENMIMAILNRQHGLNFAPGERWAYSNSGYFLVSQIVGAVEGRNLEAFAQERIFGPLGMERSHFQHNHRRLVPDKAHGYEQQVGDQYLLADSTLDIVGDGGMYTTVFDLILWDRNFYSDKLGSNNDIVTEMQTSAVLNSGETTEYGFALSLKPYRGLRRVFHPSVLAGYRAILQRFPEQHFTVALLCNSSKAKPSELANQITDIFLENLFKEDANAEKKPAVAGDHQMLKLSREQLAEYTGAYYSVEVDNSFTLETMEEGLRVLDNNLPLAVIKPVGDDVFRHPEYGYKLVFERASDGTLSGFTYNGSRVMGLTFSKEL